MVAQSTLMPLRQGLNVISMKWQSLIQRAFDPYRPELHYMRGPGPRWRAKHLELD